jgi:hypothetical protein
MRIRPNLTPGRGPGRRPGLRPGRREALALGLLAVLAPLRRAFAQTPVDLQLVLAIDTSGSVNSARYDLQQQGYATAFRDRRVLDAIRSGTTQAIAVTMFQWTGPSMHTQVVDWTLIHDAPSAGEFADTVAAVPRHLRYGGTSLSGAIDFAMTLFPKTQFQGTRRVIDISGDGSNNSGRQATDARDEAVAAGVVINGLPILTIEPDLDTWYRNNVVGGPGSFAVAVERDDQFADAILHKLVTEIAANPTPRPA